jgi:hypothetical protein
MTTRSAQLCALACLAIFAFSAPASAELIYGIAAVGNATNLVSFDSEDPTDLLSATFVTGLQPNETILGIDVRPATRQLYALGSSSRLYTLNPATGAVTPVGGQLTPLLNGFSFGFDFNPVIDRIRVVSETNKNLVLDPNTGAMQLVATDLAYSNPSIGDPNVVHSAYSNNRPGALTTQLYGIDTHFNVLVTQANNTGVLNIVNGIGFGGNSLGGFDISGVSGIAYAVLINQQESVSGLYTIDLTNGVTVKRGVIDGGLAITAMTVALIPEPSTAALFGFVVGGIFLRRRSG